MDVLAELLKDVPVPKFIPVKQLFDPQRVENIPDAVRQAVQQAGVLERVQPGKSIAIAVGSRGIANLPALVREVVTIVKDRGAHPFIVPAMGSHGGATAQGQEAMLEHLGVSEATVGAPVKAAMDVVQVGTSHTGIPVYTDALAAQADGIIVLNRIKPHTSFHANVESGLLKMLVIGLGKQKGADAAHALGFAHMGEHIWDLSKTLLQKLPVLFGVAVLENGYDQTAKVVCVPSEDLHEVEPLLLEQARAFMPRLLLRPLDVLIVDEIGKNISGVGMDPNITGRFPNTLVKPDIEITRVAILRLTEETDGNAAGIGLADITTAAAEARIDRVKGYMNSLTSTSMASVKLPMVLGNDKMAIQAAIKTSNCPDISAVRAIRIKNTLHIDEIWISEALLQEAQEHANIDVLGPATPLAFHSNGDLSL